MKTIYFIRHGESEANVAGLVAGAFDTPLTENGKQQAIKAGHDLRDKGIELIVCSPLARTVQTAELIAAAMGYDKNKIVHNELFTEARAGEMEGKPYLEYIEKRKNGVKIKGLEETHDLHERMKKGVQWLATLPEKTILLVSHGGTGKMMRVIDRELGHEDFLTMERFGNTEIDKFEI